MRRWAVLTPTRRRRLVRCSKSLALTTALVHLVNKTGQYARYPGRLDHWSTPISRNRSLPAPTGVSTTPTIYCCIPGLVPPGNGCPTPMIWDMPIDRGSTTLLSLDARSRRHSSLPGATAAPTPTPTVAPTVTPTVTPTATPTVTPTVTQL